MQVFAERVKFICGGTLHASYKKVLMGPKIMEETHKSSAILFA